MAKPTKKGQVGQPEEDSLFAGLEDRPRNEEVARLPGNGAVNGDKPLAPRLVREDVRAVQDLIWKEALFAIQAVNGFSDETAYREYLHQHLPQNSQETRSRYTQTLLRWFFPDGFDGLAAQVWRCYHDLPLAEEVLRYLYLRAEPMAGALVAEALFPIAEQSQVPGSYLANFIRSHFGQETPDKSIQRLKANLRKLGFLVRSKGDRDTLRPLGPSATALLVVCHSLFARQQAGSVEFRTLAADPFWMYLGFKSEDQLRAILKDAFNADLLAKYVLADRIESVSFRYTFAEFVAGRMRL